MIRDDMLAGLDFMARTFRRWDDWNAREREAEGLTTEVDTHVISVPPTWPTHGQLRQWVEVLTEAATEIRHGPQDQN